MGISGVEEVKKTGTVGGKMGFVYIILKCVDRVGELLTSGYMGDVGTGLVVVDWVFVGFSG